VFKKICENLRESVPSVSKKHLFFKKLLNLRQLKSPIIMTAYLLTVGDEILIGQITDTNSAWMAQQLNLQGIRIAGKASVGDVHPNIIEAMDYAWTKADLVLVTGGLGATKDDITKKAIAEYFGVEMVFHDETWLRLQYFFKKLGKMPHEMNKKGCFMPANAEILTNDRGLAPAMWFEKGGKVMVSMPGVPYEMMHLMTDRVLPRLKKSFPVSPVVHRTLMTAGEGETGLAAMLSDFEDALPTNIKLAYLPAFNQVRLRLTATGADETALNQQIDIEKAKMETIVSKFVYGYEDEPLAKAIGRMLVAKGWTLATAESCTGGYLSAQLTANAGSSAYFKGGIIAYHNDLKINLLGVKTQTLDEHGAVSEETVREMIPGALNATGADIAVAISGIAGPGGGSPKKPVGTIWVAVGNKMHTRIVPLTIDRGRNRNMEYAANVALNLVRIFLLTT
jgi:nicotinamide-nucleotide amidase